MICLIFTLILMLLWNKNKLILLIIFKKNLKMITTSRIDEFKGSVAIDHQTHGNLFNDFLQKNSIDRVNFVGIEANFPTQAYKDIIDLKILFKSDNEIRAKRVKLKMNEFLNLFTKFKIGFAPQYHVKEFEENVNSVETELE